MNRSFVLRGDLLWSRADRTLAVQPDGWLVCEDGRCAGVFDTLPDRYARLPVHDHRGALIVPGLVDLHVHAPQYAFRGLGMDLELLDWLGERTFPQEARYADPAYARTAYQMFADDLRRSATTRAVIFGTLHTDATLTLMELLEETGLVTRVGRVSMDRNSPDFLREASAEAALDGVRDWLAQTDRFSRCLPILTPRFVPSCSDALMEGLGRLQRETGLPVQSHLSENPGEVAWVRELAPAAADYGDAYARFGLFGGPDCPTIMAHCVYSDKTERDRMRRAGVFVAHCPQSNTCLSSGIAPVRAMLDEGLSVGLGTDVAGGPSLSMLRAVADAVSVSKLRWRLTEDGGAPLTLPEAFFLATRGGGAFFGQVGAFEPGFALDALVLDDSALPCPFPLTPAERLERLIYLAADRPAAHKYVDGVRLF